MYGTEAEYAFRESHKAFTISTIRMLQSLLSEAVAREAAISYPLGRNPFLSRHNRAASMQRMLVEGAIRVHGPEEQRVALSRLILQSDDNMYIPVRLNFVTREALGVWEENCSRQLMTKLMGPSALQDGADQKS